jgi:hypothetical protein
LAEYGDDILYGETGNDIMRGYPGANEFICGDGVDTFFYYNPAHEVIISNDCENSWKNLKTYALRLQ